MRYKITIQDADGGPIKGVVYFFSGDTEIGQSVVYPEGSELDGETVDASDRMVVTADGFYEYGFSTWGLGETNVITLVKKFPVALYVTAAAVAGFLISKYF